MLDGYHGIALHVMQGNRTSSRGKGKVSWFFLTFVKMGYILK